MISGRSGYDAITTVQSIGKDWGRLPHREPFHIKRSKDRRKDHHGYDSYQARDDHGPSSGEEHREPTREKAPSEGFEIIV